MLWSRFNKNSCLLIHPPAHLPQDHHQLAQLRSGNSKTCPTDANCYKQGQVLSAYHTFIVRIKIKNNNKEDF